MSIVDVVNELLLKFNRREIFELEYGHNYLYDIQTKNFYTMLPVGKHHDISIQSGDGVKHHEKDELVKNISKGNSFVRRVFTKYI